MPNFVTPVPQKLTGDMENDIKNIKEWGTALIDELSYIFTKLDAENVREASSVKAENIDTKNAKITNAQIGDLSADKITSGMINTDLLKVKDLWGRLEIKGSSIIMKDNIRTRFELSYDRETDKFVFKLVNGNGARTVSIDSDGNATFMGTIESAQVFSSTIIGTSSYNYDRVDGGVFANIDEKGVKIMQDKDGERQQKIGMTVSNGGTAYLVLGAGTGSGEHNINGVIYTDGTFKIEKNESGASMGLVGSNPFINFWDSNGELWLDGSNVKINGMNVVNEIRSIKTRLSNAGI